MSDNQFSKTFEVRWADLDPNRHFRHTAYNDYAAHVRFSFLADHGYPTEKFSELQFGPVILREETRYLREVGMHETIQIDMQLAAMSEDGSRWRMQHIVFKANNKKAAVITIDGGWLDLNERKLRTPPDELLDMVNRMPKTKDFTIRNDWQLF